MMYESIEWKTGTPPDSRNVLVKYTDGFVRQDWWNPAAKTWFKQLANGVSIVAWADLPKGPSQGFVDESKQPPTAEWFLATGWTRFEDHPLVPRMDVFRFMIEEDDEGARQYLQAYSFGDAPIDVECYFEDEEAKEGIMLLACVTTRDRITKLISVLTA